MSWTSQISNVLLDGELGFSLNEDELGWVGSLSPLGAAFFALVVGSMCDLMGRKVTMLLLIIPVTAGWALTAWPQNISMLYIGRILTGMVGGAYCVTASMYHNEISQKEIRGTLGSFIQLSLSGGVLFDAIFGKFFTIIPFTIICASVPIIFGIIFLFMPETPVYYVKIGKLDKARHSLIRLRGEEYDIDSEIEEIKLRLREEEKTHVGFREIRESFKKINTRRAAVIGLGMMILNTTIGVDPVTNYSSYIFSDIGMHPTTPAIILSSIQTGFAILQSSIVDRLSRRLLLISSTIIIAICLIIAGVMIMLKGREFIDEDTTRYTDYVTIGVFCVYFISFSMGIGPIAWLLVTEVYPEEVKSFLASLGTFITWFTCFTVLKLFIFMDTHWGGDIPFAIFAGFTIFAVAFEYILIPETKGRSLVEIQIALGASPT